MKVAALDLGSNSFLLLIAEKTKNGLRVLHDESRVTRLGQGVNQSGKLHPEALKRAKECLTDYKKTIDQFQVEKTLAVSTSAARDAKNGNELIQMGVELNIPIQIIEGIKEAELTFKGATYDLNISENTVVVDVGGGSTELISNNQGQISGFSLDVGSVRLTEMFITKHPVAEKEIENVKAYICGQLENNKNKIPKSATHLIAVAGTPTTLACILAGVSFNQGIHGMCLKLNDMEAWLVKLAKMSVQQREELPGMQPGRADVIVAGLTILVESLKYYKASELTVSIRGVRFGVAFSLVDE